MLQWARRRQALAALRAGIPESWTDYPASDFERGGRALALMRDVREGARLLGLFDSLANDPRLSQLKRLLSWQLSHKRRLLQVLAESRVVV